MNRYDIYLIVFVIVICICILVFPKDEFSNKVAKVTYKNKEVLTIDLTKDEKKIYTVEGKNGTVMILHDHGKIEVLEENSPLHLCSKQGSISKSTETIICLPNQIVISIHEKDEYDAIVK